MAFKRGFKSWCENASKGFRRDLRQELVTALDPRKVADHLGIRLFTVREIQALGGLDDKHADQLLEHDSSSWSAVTLILPETRMVIINSTHSIVRQNSDIMHELSHLILKHSPSRVDTTEAGFMILDTYDKNLEEESDWLSGSLLVPRDALLEVLSQGRSTAEAAAFFQVSVPMLEMRRRLTGVNNQLSSRLVRKD